MLNFYFLPRTQHEILIPNRSNKKICFYASSNSPCIRGPEKIMLLPNRKETYKFEVHPMQRGDIKGVITFRPGEWPVKDVDSDGEEMARAFNEEMPPQFTLWYTFDIRVQPAASQSLVELEAHVFDSATLCVPLSNPMQRKLEFKVIKNGSYLEGADQFEVAARDHCTYELRFCPRRVGKFRASVIFQNDETDEFWYDLKLIAIDALPIQLEPIEAEIGRFGVQTVQLRNPIAEKLDFCVFISNTDHFGVENRQHNDVISVEGNSSLDVNFKFMPSTIGLADHVGLISFHNERIGNITYELKGVGLEPDAQDPINITSEVNQSQMVTIYFKNTTNATVHCDLTLTTDAEDEMRTQPFIEVNPTKPVFNLLLNELEGISVPPKGALDIPIVFSPVELKSYRLNLVLTARRESRTSWNENEQQQKGGKKLDKLRWVYPIRAYSVINAISKANPFVLECLVRKRLEKRMEVVLANVSSYYTSGNRAVLKVRSVTPLNGVANAASPDSNSSKAKSEEEPTTSNSVNLAQEFIHSVQYFGNVDQCETAKNSVALKLIRTQKNKASGLVTLVFDFIFCPSKSFM